MTAENAHLGSELPPSSVVPVWVNGVACISQGSSRKNWAKGPRAPPPPRWARRTCHQHDRHSSIRKVICTGSPGARARTPICRISPPLSLATPSVLLYSVVAPSGSFGTFPRARAAKQRSFLLIEAHKGWTGAGTMPRYASKVSSPADRLPAIRTAQRPTTNSGACMYAV